ncbi:tautomerase family protein [Arthrobacter sp. KK5.5]|uniref:tautomerase family protein n=1 Tax=Arthrobacter sp. KK5.5 TaxID=3373084 RepID=UPI003EE57066
MPLLRIDLVQGRTPEQVAAVSAAIHGAVVAEYGIPDRDYFQIISEHPAGMVVAQDAGLGFERGPGVVMIQIFTQRGRSAEAKASLFRAIAAALAPLGVGGEDVFIGYVENGPEDWSFGFGVAQYQTGELAVPSRGFAS